MKVSQTNQLVSLSEAGLFRPWLSFVVLTLYSLDVQQIPNGVKDPSPVSTEITESPDQARQKNDLALMELPDEDQINNNPFILSKVHPMGDMSFVDKRQSY